MPQPHVFDKADAGAGVGRLEEQDASSASKAQLGRIIQQLTRVLVQLSEVVLTGHQPESLRGGRSAPGLGLSAHALAHAPPCVCPLACERACVLPHAHSCDGRRRGEEGLDSSFARWAPGPSIPEVVVSGGGAHKFAESMRKTSSVEMVPFQEMESLVAGLEFLSEHNPEGEVFEVDESGSRQPFVLPAVQNMFPCLLVNMGSGVSILRIDGPSEDAERSQRYQRIGGTACGGKTFLGLMRRITSATSFKEMLELAQHGDASRVNTLVADIYGEKGCAALGLPPSHTAAYFGKWPSSASSPSEAAFYPATAEADCAAALLLMVVQESVVLSRALSLLISAQVGNDYKPPVFFVGGFLAQNIAAQRIISRSYHNLNLGPALFLRHADFLGALGCLNKSLEKDHASASP